MPPLFPKVEGSPGILGGSSPPPLGHGCGRYSGGFCRPIPKRPLGNTEDLPGQSKPSDLKRSDDERMGDHPVCFLNTDLIDD